jgi:protease-4
VDFLQHGLGVLLMLFGLRAERVEETLVFTRRQQTPFNAQLFHRSGKAEAIHQHAEKHKQHAQTMLKEIHQQFIEVVRTGRGKRLHETPEMFSGLFWTGARAIEMGLADDLGSVDSVARDVVKAEDVIDYTQHEGLPERVLKKFGAAVGTGAIKAVTQSVKPELR